MGRAAASSARRVQGRLVSAPVASPAEQDKVRELQRTLYRAAEADPGRRFHALYDKLLRRDVLERAWGQVRANRGAAGMDRVTLAAVEQYGVGRLLDELAADLKDESYGLLPEARLAGAAAALDPDGTRPGRAGGHEDGARTDLRGRLRAVLLRLPAEAVGARCPATHPR